MERDRFVILDGQGLIFRAIYRPGPPLTSPSGEPTRGTFTYCASLFALVEKLRPAYLAMAVDAPRKSTFRRKLFPAYKAHRKGDADGPPPEVVVQLARCIELTKALGVPTVGAKHFEADDVIATLVKVCASDEVECVIVTRDKDLQQLVGKNCRVFDPLTNDWFGVREVENKWGVKPSKLVDLFAMQGDKSDGVPGVRGIGPKKALALLQQHGSAHAAADALGWDKKNLELMFKLVRLRDDLELDVAPEDLAFDALDVKNARPLFRKLGFRSYL